MKKKVSVKSFLFFLMLMILLVAGGYRAMSGKDVGVSKNTASGFTKDDLTGTWHVHALYGGSKTGWIRSIITVGPDGSVTFHAYDDRSGGRPVASVLTIDSMTGVVTDSGSPDSHLTMASNKKLIAGTLDSSGSSRPGIIIFQKEVPGTTYTDSDLQRKSFVYHELKSCGKNIDNNEWEYGAGGMGSDSGVTRSSKIKPGGIYVSLEDLGSMSVDSKGIVRMSGDKIFEGYFSHDKKTIIGTTAKRDSGMYIMLIIQMTDHQSASAADVAGTWHCHMLAVGSAALWAHQAVQIASGGKMTFGNRISSNPAWNAPSGERAVSVSSSGTVTMSGSSVPEITFNGQVSYDGTFIAATQTPDTGEYSLVIFTKKP